MAIRVPVRLASIEAYIVQRHGSARQLSLMERRVLRGFADQIVLDIQEVWPIDTGLSQSAFESVMHSQVGSIGFDIFNDVDYVEFVHRAGDASKTPLWTTVIPAIIQGYGPRLVAAMKRAIDRTEAGLRSTGARFIDILQDPNFGRVAA